MSPAAPSLAAPDDELKAVLAALIDGVRPILEDNFVGAYLQGSFALGGAIRHSDVDFIIAVRADMPDALVPAIQAVHVRVFDLSSDWARHLEGSYFPLNLLRRPDSVGQPLLYVDNGSRVLERSPHDNTLVVRWVLWECGLTLMGPAPRSLLDPVPAAALKQEVWTDMQQWAAAILAAPERLNNDWAQPFVVLSYCRMLETLATGRIHAKPAAAAWARQTLPARWHGLIERAQAAHARQRLLGRGPADPADLAATVEFVRLALAAGPNGIGGP